LKHFKNNSVLFVFLSKFYGKMGKIEWAMWANEQAVASSVGKRSKKKDSTPVTPVYWGVPTQYIIKGPSI
jgi:hypothetical protein